MQDTALDLVMMNRSVLSMSGFALADTPGSVRHANLSLDEFDNAAPMALTYCQQMTEEQYENQGAETTQMALKV